MWLLALGWLVQRNYLRPVSAVLAEATLRVPPGATYFAIQAGGRQIGFAASQLDTLRDTIRIQDVTVLHVPTSGTTERFEVRTLTNLTRTLDLRAFETSVRADHGRFVARGTLSDDSLLRVEIETVDGTRSSLSVIRRPLVMPALLPLHVAFVDRAIVGKSYALQLFDPVTMTLRDVNVSVTADSTFVFPDSAVFDSATARWEPARWDTAHAWRLSEVADGIERQLWVDELGQIVHAGVTTGYSLGRTAFEVAFENFQSARREPAAPEATAPEIVRATAIASNVTLPSRQLGELRLGIRRVEPDAVAPHRIAHQVVDTLVIRRVHPDATASAEDSADAFARFTAPDLLIESTDPRIAAQARQIVGRTRAPLSIAEQLNQWVFATVEKRRSTQLLSAVEVLDRRRGDCNEHTTLYIALARAMGLPARRVAGFLYVDGRFYYHAWPEVFINSWVPVDPTLGQVPADARHVRLTTGGLAGHLEFVQSIGPVRFDVISSDGIT